MDSLAKEFSLVTFVLCGLIAAALANPGTDEGKSHPKKEQGRWTLSTADTSITISISNNKIYITRFSNPSQDWNWTPLESEVPLPGPNSIRGAGDATGGNRGPNWTFSGATESTAKGHTLSLTFTSAEPKLELKSVWQTRPGAGPVENLVTIENRSKEKLVYSHEIAAAMPRLIADKSVQLWYFEKTNAGHGRVSQTAIGPNTHITVDKREIPFIMLDAGSTHGLYIGYEWEVGNINVESGTNPLAVTATVMPITEDITQEPGEIFNIPSVYYGAYKGDTDDGSNAFKRWFWNYKVPRSLHDHADEPWTEMCMSDVGGAGNSSITGTTPQSLYDRLAATGVELVKMDFWDGTGKGWYTNRDWMYHPAVWPNGFDFAAKAHKAGLKASLYMGGTYNDCDLGTIAGRDAELAAVLERYDKGWFDIWRTDHYTAPEEPMPQTYNGVTNFLYIQDYLIKHRPGYRYENCSNGGTFKGFSICRRMTFCTMNDVDNNANVTRTTYYSNSYAINPVQLKSDLGPATTSFDIRTDMMGSILTCAVDNPVYREHIALYKTKQRPILRGADVYHILPMADGVNWDGLEYFNPGIRKGSVFLFKPSNKAVDGSSKTVKLKGLDRGATYTVSFQDRTNLDCAMTGTQLMDNGITVTGMTGDRASEIIWINESTGEKRSVAK